MQPAARQTFKQNNQTSQQNNKTSKQNKQTNHKQNNKTQNKHKAHQHHSADAGRRNCFAAARALKLRNNLTPRNKQQLVIVVVDIVVVVVAKPRQAAWQATLDTQKARRAAPAVAIALRRTWRESALDARQATRANAAARRRPPPT